jgi:hypothetical protein
MICPRCTQRGQRIHPMRMPSWSLPVVVILFAGIRIFMASRFRAKERMASGKGWFESVPIWIKGLWVLLAMAVVILIIWAPKEAKPPGQSRSTDPALASGPTAGK